MFGWLETLGIELEALTFGSIALAISELTGGEIYLMVLLQWIFLIDFIIGQASAIVGKRFDTLSVWNGIQKYISLYFGIILVGLGTKAFDISIHDTIDFTYSGTFFFNVFLYLLLVYELSSINRHLSRCGFPINKGLENVFKIVFNRITHKTNIDIKYEDIHKKEVKNEK